MRTRSMRPLVFVALLATAVILSGCDENFYLSEKEVAAYNKAFATQASLNAHFDNLQGRSIVLNFANVSGTPKLQTTNLLAEMRRTELAQLETGQATVSLDRVAGELETQIGKWVEDRLELYTAGGAHDDVRLTRLDTVTVEFLANPTFTFVPERQSIAYDLRVRLDMIGTIDVQALNWLINLFAGINGAYPLQLVMPDLQLRGEAQLNSPLSNAGRIRFVMIPEFNAPAQVNDVGVAIPDAVKDGVRNVMTQSLSSRIDELFDQEYFYFAISQLRLSAENPSRLQTFYRYKADWLGPDAARPQMHLVTRASDGKLYHAGKGNGAWTAYTAIPFAASGSASPPRFDNDPVLLHSGQNQLELAAVNNAGELAYAHYRDGEWGNTKFVKANNGYNPPIFYRGIPAVAASAPGQVEIVVEGSDGQLWHHRRINGVWIAPARIRLNGFPNVLAPFRDPVAVVVGNKVVLLLVDSLNRLITTAYDLETGVWAQPSKFTTSTGAPTSIVFAPAMVASGERRSGTVAQSQIEVAYVKAGGAVFHQVISVNVTNITSVAPNSGVSFINQERVLNGVTANASPVLTSSTNLQPELFVRGTDNKLRHNHFVYALGGYWVGDVFLNPGWQGWSTVTENFVSDTPHTDGRVGLYAAAGTNTGKTLVVAHGYDATKQFYFHDEFESGRYGRATAPWKTVHWRGWEVAGFQAPVGRPALAVVDRSFQIAHVSNRAGFGSTAHTEQISDTNATYFVGLTSPIRTIDPIAPILLSSGPGVYDLIAMRGDGRPEHNRQFYGGGGYVSTLFVPAGVSLLSMSAVTYGNGFLELVARAGDNRVFHWRYRNGAWSTPVVLATQVVSTPVIVHRGAGQLELLGIDVDHHMFRWLFFDNAWHPRLSVPHDFRINEDLFAASSVSSWGDGTIDVAVVGLDTRALYHRRVGPGDEVCTARLGCPAPRVFSNLGGSINEDPVLTAFSPTRINVLAMRGLSWYSIWGNRNPVRFTPIPPPIDPSIQWSGFESIGGSEMLVGGAAHAGRNNFSALALREGRFFVNRYLNGTWTGFQPVVGQRPEQILRLPIIPPAISSHGH